MYQQQPKKTLMQVDALDEDDLANTLGAPDSDEEMVSSEEDASDADSDDDRLRYEEMVEDYIDGAYQDYLDRKSLRAAREVEQRKRKRMGDEGVLCYLKCRNLLN